MIATTNCKRLWLAAALWAASLAAAAGPVISIILDDMGYRWRDGQRAVDLEGALTYAILPHAPYSRRLAERAHRRHKEIMLHLPMESEAGRRLGPGGLHSGMTEKEFKRRVFESLNAVPHVRGFNNHMGSRLTRSPIEMGWLMQAAMFRNDLYFVDSRTTAETVAEQEARRRGIVATRRDIFLDYAPGRAVVETQLDTLVRRARRQGHALAIGHPHPDTLAALEHWLPTLAGQGIRLVPVSQLIQTRQQRRIPPWQLSSYPSPRAVKSSKP